MNQNFQIIFAISLIFIGLVSVIPYVDAQKYGVYEDYYIKYDYIDWEIDYSSYDFYLDSIEPLIDLFDEIFGPFDNTELEFTGVESIGAYVTFTDHDTGEVRQSGFLQYGVMNDYEIPSIISTDKTWGDSVWIKPTNDYRDNLKLDYSGIVEDHGVDHLEFTYSFSDRDLWTESLIYYDADTGFFTGFRYEIDFDDGYDYLSGYYDVRSYEIGTYVYGQDDYGGYGSWDTI